MSEYKENLAKYVNLKLPPLGRYELKVKNSNEKEVTKRFSEITMSLEKVKKRVERRKIEQMKSFI